MFINQYGKRAWIYIKRYPLHYSGYLIFALGFFASAKYFKKSENQIIRMAFAGSLAQCVTDIILHPIDVINTRTKAEIAEGKVNSWRMIKRISINEGVFGFWRGASVTYYAALVAGIVYFSVYKFLKTYILKHQTESSGKMHVLAYLSSSLIGEALLLLFYYPYDLIRTRMQTRMCGFNYKGPYDGFKQIVDGKFSNIRKLYVGATPCFVLCMASQSILFTVLETMREHYIKKLKVSSVNDLPRGIYLLCSIVSGGVAGGLTNLLEVVTINKQVDPHFKLRKFIKEQGFKSLTQGLIARVVIHVLHAVLFFYTVDEFARMFDVEL